ncbi:MAG: adenylate/guanylate cyclase domain-containing protein [Mariprofundaceae bacterium]|nr:adenylate/guanylate cyclase domain-containing protein [Mariprofundaceae bacterium]
MGLVTKTLLTSQSARFPVRWRWTMIVGLAVTAAVLVLALIVLDLERDAWLDNQETQAGVLVDRLGDELKIPMLAGSSAEIDFIMRNFAEKVPAVQAVYFSDASLVSWSVGFVDDVEDILSNTILPEATVRLTAKTLWYAKQVTYGGTDVAVIAVRYSEDAWADLASQLLFRMLSAAFFVIFLAAVLVYWLAGQISKSLEDLASAARHVALGNYTHVLEVSGNDELSDAAHQFNKMVQELQHKDEIRKVFGRYLNPKLVSDVFEGGNSSSMLNRKQEVTVLFADMVGFTAFSESTDTEEVVDVLNQHFEVFHSIIDYYGGHVDKYIGDAVMAVFNHPKQNEHHVRNAVMAGIAMTVACRKLGVLRKNGETVSFRVGLNRGDVIVGNIGAAERLEYTVIGDAVNVASRMGGLGEGGEVVMPFATFEAAEEGFSFYDMGELQVKGVRDPLRCGVVSALDETKRRDLAYAVAQAFDMTLPTDVRMIIGDI